MSRQGRSCYTSAFATVAETESLAGPSARLTEHEALKGDDARGTQGIESGDGRQLLEGSG
jgi:hypothetical protein